MIGATLNADAIMDRLGGLPDKADSAIRATAADLALRLRDRAQGNLSGVVLNARSGALRASLAISLDQAAGLQASPSAAAPYAAFQEYGFNGNERVRAHLRLQAKVFGKPTRPTEVQVGPHGRRVNYPAHSYLRSALADMSAEIRDSIAGAVEGALA